MTHPEAFSASFPVYFNREGFFYMNPALKIHAAQAMLRHKIL